MSIYLTGDLHGAIKHPKLYNNFLTKDDYLILLGDTGLMFLYSFLNERVEEFKKIEYLSNNIPYTLLLTLGNHDNYDYYNSLPVEEWNSGKVSFLRNNIIRLHNGSVFDIEGKSFFTMGGSESIDKMYRVEGITWWSQEMPSNEEYDEAIDNLQLNDWKVDYVITHCAPDSIQDQIIPHSNHNKLTNFLEVVVKNDLKYKHWYFAHYHRDQKIDEKHSVVYNKIISLGDKLSG